jgi:hypothetical protein
LLSSRDDLFPSRPFISVGKYRWRGISLLPLRLRLWGVLSEQRRRRLLLASRSRPCPAFPSRFLILPQRETRECFLERPRSLMEADCLRWMASAFALATAETAEEKFAAHYDSNSCVTFYRHASKQCTRFERPAPGGKTLMPIVSLRRQRDTICLLNSSCSTCLSWSNLEQAIPWNHRNS